MKLVSLFVVAASVLPLALFLTGCGSAQTGTPTKGPSVHHAGHSDHGEQVDKEEQKANFGELSGEDRTLAEAQGYCAVTSEPLGSMGPPLKLMIEDQAVFVCCKGCEKKAKSNPDKTLAKVQELKERVKSESTN